MRTLIRDVRVFDGVRMLPRGDVLIEGERFGEAGVGGALEVASGAGMARDGGVAGGAGVARGGERGGVDVVVEGAGRVVVPGLIDAHTHTFDGSLAQALAAGVTTELDMFCLPGNLKRQRELAATRDDVADLRSSGVLATAPHGHPSQIMSQVDEQSLGALGHDSYGAFATVAGPEHAAAFVDARVAEGIDYLKIVIEDGSEIGQQLPTLQAETVKALVKAGHAAGLQTIAHIATANDALMAIDAGIDGLAHVFTDAGPDNPLAAEVAGKAAERGVFVVTTLVYIEALTQAAMPADRRAKAAYAVQVLREAGVPLLAGTDANPYAPQHGASMHRELELLVQAGMSEIEALRAATSVTAEQFGLTDRGRIAPGLRADLLLLDSDPTEDITAIGKIAGIWRRGTRQR